MRTPLATSLIAVALATAATPALASDFGVRLPFEAVLQTTSLPPINSGPGYEDRCGGAPTTVIEGAGTATLLGPVHDSQSHCLGFPEVDANGKMRLPFFAGIFVLTDHYGRTFTGHYFGALVQTITSVLPTATSAPAGSWIIEGHVCMKSASHVRIVDDCAANRYAPARGITDLGTGAASIFLDQTYKLRW
jgi:hypothetical protein